MLKGRLCRWLAPSVIVGVIGALLGRPQLIDDRQEGRLGKGPRPRIWVIDGGKAGGRGV